MVRRVKLRVKRNVTIMSEQSAAVFRLIGQFSHRNSLRNVLFYKKVKSLCCHILIQMRKKSKNSNDAEHGDCRWEGNDILSSTEADPIIGKFRPAFPPAVLKNSRGFDLCG